MTHYVIIGGGIAGTSAAEQLRKLDPTCAITILSNESHPLYSRVLLPHYIHGKVPRERVFLKKEDWYTGNNIALVYTTVERLDPDAHTVHASNGETYTYTKLLIAGGGTLNKLPIDASDQVYHLQTIEDADKLVDLLEHNEEGAVTAGVIGGGFITMELVEFFARKQWKSHVFLRGTLYFGRTFNQAMSDLLEEHLEQHNIQTHKELTIASYQNDMAKTHENGAFTVDVLSAGIGINSRFPWAKDAGVEVERGVKCNEYLETNVADIYTAGDCAEYWDTTVERHLHIGNWMNAQMQGRHAASILTGNRTPFSLVSSYATHVLGIDIVAVGDAEVAAAEQVIERDYSNGYTLLLLRNHKLVGASIINRNTDRKAVTHLIKNRVDLTEHIDQLDDPTFDLSSLLS